MASVKRLVCHFLIVWLALLSGGAHAHAAADAAQELGHIAVHAVEAQRAAADGADASVAAHDHGHAETCSLSHCGHGHATGMLPNAHLQLGAAPASAPLPTQQAWASREQPNSIERPKWAFTTPAVVNL
ncbi:MAG: hypothetical protein C0428_11200 [Polaromonas sp.]|nr:hypothetical protein [Polaromonas sp.]